MRPYSSDLMKTCWSPRRERAEPSLWRLRDTLRAMSDSILRLQEAFKEFDQDGNGRIDRDEFDALLKKLGADLSRNEADAAFKDIDQNGNSAVEFEEFARWWKLQPGG